MEQAIENNKVCLHVEFVQRAAIHFRIFDDDDANAVVDKLFLMPGVSPSLGGRSAASTSLA